MSSSLTKLQNEYQPGLRLSGFHHSCDSHTYILMQVIKIVYTDGHTWLCSHMLRINWRYLHLKIMYWKKVYLIEALTTGTTIPSGTNVSKHWLLGSHVLIIMYTKTFVYAISSLIYQIESNNSEWTTCNFVKENHPHVSMFCQHALS